MNKHFEDARYYLKRAGEHTRAGVAEELDPVVEKVRAATGRESEPEAGRLERVRGELITLEKRAEGEAKKAVADARERIERRQSGN